MANVKEQEVSTFPDPSKMQDMLPSLCQFTDRHGNTVYYGDTGDYWHPGFPIGKDSDYRTHLRQVRDMNIREDDILICSYPKTGLHWQCSVISMLMNKEAAHVPDTVTLAGFLDFIPAAKIDQLSSPRLLFTHMPFRYVPRQAFEKKIKIVLLDRNPKDVMVSYYNHLRGSQYPLNFPGSFEHFFELNMEVGYYYGKVFDYTMEWQEGMEAHPDVPVYISVYEDLKKDVVGGIKKLNEYLGTGCTPELCEQIAVECDFKKMKDYKDANTPEIFKAMFKKDATGFYRKGEVGDWKNWFTVAMNEKFDEEYEKKMKGFKRQHTFTS